MTPSPRSSKTTGVVLLLLGLLGLGVAYHFRPPSGFIDALGMMVNGRQHYLEKPVYLTCMAISGGMALFGLVALVRARPSE